MLVNESGHTFQRIWLSPSDNASWNLDRDIVSREYNGNSYSLPNGWSTEITLADEEISYWDLRVDCDGKKHEWHELDFTNIVQISINSDFIIRFLRASELI